MDFFTHCWKKPKALSVARLALSLPLVLGLMACSGATSDSEPSITLLSANAPTQQTQQGAVLTLDHQFSAEVLDALRHGVPVTLQWQIELRKPRAALWDAVLWKQSQERQISYRSLSRRFTLSLPASGEATSFIDLPALLRALSRVETTAVPAPLAEQDAYYQVRERLVISRLPPALRLSSYLSDQWRMDTGWVPLSESSP